MSCLTILGATGSIGQSTLSVVRHNPERYRVTALTAQQNVEKMQALCLEFQPEYAVMVELDAAAELKRNLAQAGCRTEVLSGKQALCDVASLDGVDMVMAAIVGAAGLLPTMAAVKAGKRVFDVRVQGKKVLADFDVVKEAGGRHVALVKEFPGVKASDRVWIELESATQDIDGKPAPMLSAVEVVEE